MFRMALFSAGLWLMASTAQAQVGYGAAPNDGEIVMCATRMCRAAIADVAEFTPRPSSAAEDRATCSAANNALGRWISMVGANIQRRYDRREFTYDQAADTRAFIYSETWLLRDMLRQAVGTGDVRRCEQLKDRAILVINQILRSAVGYNGPSQSEGFAYGNRR